MTQLGSVRNIVLSYHINIMKIYNNMGQWRVYLAWGCGFVVGVRISGLGVWFCGGSGGLWLGYAVYGEVGGGVWIGGMVLWWGGGTSTAPNRLNDYTGAFWIEVIVNLIYV